MDLDPMIAILTDALRSAYRLIGTRLREIILKSASKGVIPAGDALVIVRTRNELEQLKGSGLEKIVGALLAKKRSALARLADKVLQEAVSAGLKKEFTDTGRNIIEALGKITDDQVRELAVGVTDELTRYTMQTMIAGGPADGLLDKIATKLDIRADQAETVSEAMIAGFERSLMVNQAKESGIELFAYLGPDDGITRPWCKHWVDRCGTPEEFEETADEWNREKQPLPVMVYGGGFNCRHRFVPLVTEEQRARYERGPNRGRE